MKRLILLCSFVLISIQSFSLVPYACITKNVVLEYIDYDENGIESGSSKITIEDVSGSNDNYEISQTTEILSKDEDGPITAKSNLSIKNGMVSISTSSSGVSVSVSESDIIGVPSQLAVGMKLNLGNVTLNTMGSTMLSTITANDVVGREELTVPAGAFKCYIIQQTATSTVMGFPIATTSKIWYARGIGPVKTETYVSNVKMSSQILKSIKK